MTAWQSARWDEGSFVGGALCLDFANTVGGRDKDRSQSYLSCYADFLDWCRSARAVDEADADALRRRAKREASEAAKALAHALSLREVLYRLFSSTAAAEPQDKGDLALFNAALTRCLHHAALLPKAGGYDWRWTGPEDDLERPLWPMLRSAMALMTGPDLTLLRECGRCSWLFLDRSKNRRRRWCKMEVCGNRAKSQRRYRRIGGQTPV